jgi:hypothetical protein
MGRDDLALPVDLRRLCERRLAAGLGGVWLVGRIAYAVAYAADPARAGASRWGAGLWRPGLVAGGGVMWQLDGCMNEFPARRFAGWAAPAMAAPPCRPGAEGGCGHRVGHLVRRLYGGAVPGGLFQQVKGAGIGGGPYDCAEGSTWRALNNCMSPKSWAPPPSPTRSSRAWIPRPPAHRPAGGLADDKVWVLTGGADHTVEPPVVDALVAFYRQWMPARRSGGACRMRPRDDLGGRRRPNACDTSEPPFINRCGDFDAPGELLGHLLGPLKPASGRRRALQAFDQRPFIAGRPRTSAWRSRASPMCRQPAGPAAARCMWPSTAAAG